MIKRTIAATALVTGSGGYYAGQQSVDQVVIIRPPINQELKSAPNKGRLEQQLKEAGIEVIFDDIVTVQEEAWQK